MKLRQEARVLKKKAIASLTAAVSAFNSPIEDGRHTLVLLTLQHSFEMLLKAALVQAGVSVFDKKLGRSIGFEKCIELARQCPAIKLRDSEAGTLRTIDALRDDEQHWFNDVSEQILYLHARAGITSFDEILTRVFADRLGDYLPNRVLPLSLDPPAKLEILLDSEFKAIEALLAPGRRATHDARARIRALLALESHVNEETRVSSKDVDRVQNGIRQGQSRSEVFPRLNDLDTRVGGTGATITVHVTKREGAPVRYVSDESSPAAAIREVDMQKKFYLSASDLAVKLGLTAPRAVALRRHLGIDTDPKCSRTFKFGSQNHVQYSDNALTSLREARDALDMELIWSVHSPVGNRDLRGPCTQPNCAEKKAD